MFFSGEEKAHANLEVSAWRIFSFATHFYFLNYKNVLLTTTWAKAQGI